jgi:hypothetical protein
MPTEPGPSRRLAPRSEVVTGSLTLGGACLGPFVCPLVVLPLYSWAGRAYRHDPVAFIYGCFMCGLAGYLFGALAGHALGRWIDTHWLEHRRPARADKE